ALTGRSARPADVGEFIASLVFDIALADSATQAGHDGACRSGPLERRTVNVKMYGDTRDGIDISGHPCDFYLVLTGPSRTSAGVHHRSWRIAAAYLFDMTVLLPTLQSRGVMIGTATSLRKHDLQESQLYPVASRFAPLRLSAEQSALLSLFA